MRGFIYFPKMIHFGRLNSIAVNWKCVVCFFQQEVTLKIISFQIFFKIIKNILFYINQFHFMTNKILMQLFIRSIRSLAPPFNLAIYMVD